ncbi:MAG TPA: hypothetical protein ENK20_12535 [Chromatiales bacterium]|nr:hypothetical protein [Chromatiales bacterium]
MGVRAALAVAALWGLAEATLFFLVPDVWLTLLATRAAGAPAPWRRLLLPACLAATAGAVAGGLLMHAWGAHDPAAALAAVERVPAVSAEMAARVRAGLEAHGLAALFLGPLTGTPYKLYAVQAGALGIGAAAFAAVSVPARLARFLVLSWAAAALARRLRPRWRVPAALAAWALFYAWFFSVMPG